MSEGKVKLQAVLTVEYEADPKDYQIEGGTPTTPEAMARLDEESFLEDPAFLVTMVDNTDKYDLHVQVVDPDSQIAQVVRVVDPTPLSREYLDALVREPKPFA